MKCSFTILLVLVLLSYTYCRQLKGGENTKKHIPSQNSTKNLTQKDNASELTTQAMKVTIQQARCERKNAKVKIASTNYNNNQDIEEIGDIFAKMSKIPFFQKIFNKPQEQINVPRYYIPILVVADRSFINFHKHIDYDDYIKNAINMVSEYFHDSSIGVNVSVSVSRTIYLDKESDVFRNDTAFGVLHNFCAWTNKKQSDNSSYDVHRVAVLVTRQELVGNENKSVQGATYTASACVPQKACIIVRDTGLLLGVNIAHQLGHVLGASDDEDQGTPSNLIHRSVMLSPVKHDRVLWSESSRMAIGKLFSDGLGKCLEEQPSSLKRYPSMLPGAAYNADMQCQLLHKGPRSCYLNNEDFCKQLFCEQQNGSCISSGTQPAQGTSCGTDRWCFNTECVHLGYRPGAVNGGWGEWQKWGPCSRTCGGGVKMSQRLCSNPTPAHGGRHCVGSPHRANTCNTQACQTIQPSFRAVQCVKLFGQSVTTEHNGRATGCILRCSKSDKDRVVMLQAQAADGTPCKPGTNDMCVKGACLRVGCDWIFGSSGTEDRCGVCGGDGSGCQLVHIHHNTSGPLHGNNSEFMGTLPRWSTRVKIYETEPSANHLALAVSHNRQNVKRYLVGGRNQPFYGEFKVGGLTGYYTHLLDDQDYVMIKGPLPFDINLYQIVVSKNLVPVHYSYMALKKSPRMSNRGRLHTKSKSCNYEWEYLEWCTCSARCEGGFQRSRGRCVSPYAGVVADTYCDEARRPRDQIRMCNLNSCRSRWEVGPWRENGSTKLRTVVCIREVKQWQSSPVLSEESLCAAPKPPTVTYRSLNNNNTTNNNNKTHNVQYTPVSSVNTSKITKQNETIPVHITSKNHNHNETKSTTNTPTNPTLISLSVKTSKSTKEKETIHDQHAVVFKTSKNHNHKETIHAQHPVVPKTSKNHNHIETIHAQHPVVHKTSKNHNHKETIHAQHPVVHKTSKNHNHKETKSTTNTSTKPTPLSLSVKTNQTTKEKETKHAQHAEAHKTSKNHSNKETKSTTNTSTKPTPVSLSVKTSKTTKEKETNHAQRAEVHKTSKNHSNKERKSTTNTSTKPTPVSLSVKTSKTTKEKETKDAQRAEEHKTPKNQTKSVKNTTTKPTHHKKYNSKLIHRKGSKTTHGPGYSTQKPQNQMFNDKKDTSGLKEIAIRELETQLKPTYATATKLSPLNKSVKRIKSSRQVKHDTQFEKPLKANRSQMCSLLDKQNLLLNYEKYFTILEIYDKIQKELTKSETSTHLPFVIYNSTTKTWNKNNWQRIIDYSEMTTTHETTDVVTIQEYEDNITEISNFNIDSLDNPYRNETIMDKDITMKLFPIDDLYFSQILNTSNDTIQESMDVDLDINNPLNTSNNIITTAKSTIKQATANRKGTHKLVNGTTDMLQPNIETSEQILNKSKNFIYKTLIDYILHNNINFEAIQNDYSSTTEPITYDNNGIFSNENGPIENYSTSIYKNYGTESSVETLMQTKSQISPTKYNAGTISVYDNSIYSANSDFERTELYDTDDYNSPTENSDYSTVFENTIKSSLSYYNNEKHKPSRPLNHSTWSADSDKNSYENTNVVTIYPENYFHNAMLKKPNNFKGRFLKFTDWFKIQNCSDDPIGIALDDILTKKKKKYHKHFYHGTRKPKKKKKLNGFNSKFTNNKMSIANYNDYKDVEDTVREKKEPYIISKTINVSNVTKDETAITTTVSYVQSATKSGTPRTFQINAQNFIDNKRKIKYNKKNIDKKLMEIIGKLDTLKYAIEEEKRHNMFSNTLKSHKRKRRSCKVKRDVDDVIDVVENINIYNKIEDRNEQQLSYELYLLQKDNIYIVLVKPVQLSVSDQLYIIVKTILNNSDYKKILGLPETTLIFNKTLYKVINKSLNRFDADAMLTKILKDIVRAKLNIKKNNKVSHKENTSKELPYDSNRLSYKNLQNLITVIKDRNTRKWDDLGKLLNLGPTKKREGFMYTYYDFYKLRQQQNVFYLKQKGNKRKFNAYIILQLLNDNNIKPLIGPRERMVYNKSVFEIKNVKQVVNIDDVINTLIKLSMIDNESEINRQIRHNNCTDKTTKLSIIDNESIINRQIRQKNCTDKKTKLSMIDNESEKKHQIRQNNCTNRKAKLSMIDNKSEINREIREHNYTDKKINMHYDPNNKNLDVINNFNLFLRKGYRNISQVDPKNEGRIKRHYRYQNGKGFRHRARKYITLLKTITPNITASSSTSTTSTITNAETNTRKMETEHEVNITLRIALKPEKNSCITKYSNITDASTTLKSVLRPTREKYSPSRNKLENSSLINKENSFTKNEVKAVDLYGNDRYCYVEDYVPVDDETIVAADVSPNDALNDLSENAYRAVGCDLPLTYKMIRAKLD